MTQNALIAVPDNDAADLEALQQSLGLEQHALESKAFDGITMLQILVPVTIATIPVLKTWINARYKHRRSQTVSLKGVKFSGYSPNEIKDLLALLEPEIDTTVDLRQGN